MRIGRVSPAKDPSPRPSPLRRGEVEPLAAWLRRWLRQRFTGHGHTESDGESEKRPEQSQAGSLRYGWIKARATTGSVTVLVTGVLIWSVPRLPWGLVAYGRYLPGKSDLGKLLYVGEGMNASIAVTELSTGVRN